MNFNEFIGLLEDVGYVLKFLAHLPADDRDVILKIDAASHETVVVGRSDQSFIEFLATWGTADQPAMSDFIVLCDKPGGCSSWTYATMLFHSLENYVLAGGSRFHLKQTLEHAEAQVRMLRLQRV